MVVKINRRDLLFASGLSLLAGTRAFGHLPRHAQSQTPGSPAARVNSFDLGAMTDEVAALNGGRAFHILVLPGPGSRQAVLGPGRSFASVSSDEFDEFRAGDQRLTRVLSNANATGHEVIDFRAQRPLAQRGLEGWNPS